jgi:hypothetical protein
VLRFVFGIGEICCVGRNVMLQFGIYLHIYPLSFVEKVNKRNDIMKTTMYSYASRKFLKCIFRMQP